jgi:hypothetical protein
MSYMVMQMEELLGGVNEDTDTSTAGSRISTSKFYWPSSAASLSLGPEHLDRADENRGNLSAPPKLIDGYAPSARLALRAYPNLLVPLLVLAGYEPTFTEGNGTNEVQTLSATGTPTGGTFTLTYGTEVTANLPYNATPAQVQEALEGLRGIKPGDVVCAGTDSLTGGTSPETAVAETTPGATGSVTDPDGAGVPADAFLVTFAKRDGAPAKTCQLIAAYTEHSTFLQGNGFGVSGLSLSAAGELSADLMGLYARRVADPSLTPSFDAASVLPMRRGDIRLDWLSGSAYSQDFSVAIANDLERGDHLGIASYYPKVLEHNGMGPKVTGSIAKRTLDPDDYDALVSAETFAASVRWVGASTIGSTGKPYSVFMEFPACQYVGGDPDEQTNSRRFGASFEWEAAYDESAADDATISVVCGVEAVEAFA